MKCLPAVRVPEFLRDVVDVAAVLLVKRAGLDEATAIEIAQEIAVGIAQAHGGTKVYVPSGTWNRWPSGCFDLSKRDLAIYREFNGQNRADLMAKYGISKSRLYQIVGAVRKGLRVAQAAGRTPLQPPPTHCTEE